MQKINEYTIGYVSNSIAKKQLQSFSDLQKGRIQHFDTESKMAEQCAAAGLAGAHVHRYIDFLLEEYFQLGTAITDALLSSSIKERGDITDDLLFTYDKGFAGYSQKKQIMWQEENARKQCRRLLRCFLEEIAFPFDKVHGLHEETDEAMEMQKETKEFLNSLTPFPARISNEHEEDRENALSITTGYIDDDSQHHKLESIVREVKIEVVVRTARSYFLKIIEQKKNSLDAA